MEAVMPTDDARKHPSSVRDIQFHPLHVIVRNSAHHEVKVDREIVCGSLEDIELSPGGRDSVLSYYADWTEKRATQQPTSEVGQSPVALRAFCQGPSRLCTEAAAQPPQPDSSNYEAISDTKGGATRESGEGDCTNTAEERATSCDEVRHSQHCQCRVDMGQYRGAGADDAFKCEFHCCTSRSPGLHGSALSEDEVDATRTSSGSIRLQEQPTFSMSASADFAARGLIRHDHPLASSMQERPTFSTSASADFDAGVTRGDLTLSSSLQDRLSSWSLRAKARQALAPAKSFRRHLSHSEGAPVVGGQDLPASPTKLSTADCERIHGQLSRVLTFRHSTSTPATLSEIGDCQDYTTIDVREHEPPYRRPPGLPPIHSSFLAHRSEGGLHEDLAPSPVHSMATSSGSFRHVLHVSSQLIGEMLFVAFLVALVTIFFIYFYITYRRRDVVNALGLWAPFAKGFAGCCNLCMALLFFMMSRTTISWLQHTLLGKKLRLDRHVQYHIVVAVALALASVGHTVCHMAGTFVHLARDFTLVEVNGILGEHFSHRPSYARLLLLTVPGLTGVLLVLLLAIVLFYSRKPVRRRKYQTFWAVHQLLYVPVVVLLLVHGTSHWLSFPHFWIFFTVPFIIFFIDKFLRWWQRSLPLVGIARRLEADTVTIEVPRPDWFNYQCGEYIRLCVPHVRRFEAHALSITSSPYESDRLRVHIRAVGDWSRDLLEEVKASEKGTSHLVPTAYQGKGYVPMPVFVDGPFGAPTQWVLQYPHVVLMATGIGVTPFVSVLRTVQVQKARGLCKTKTVRLVWVNRSYKSLFWFSDVLEDVLGAGTEDWFTLSPYLTGTEELPPYMADLGIPRQRPHWRRLLVEMARANPTWPSVAVFCVGPEQMVTAVRSATHQATQETGIFFPFFRESF